MRSAEITKNKSTKMKDFSRRKPTTQKPHRHHKTATTSPQKIITKIALFPKPTEKSP